MLRLELFGGAVLTDGSVTLDVLTSRRHPVALLALLATTAARTLSRGKLVGLLWPDVPEKTARNRLTSCVYNVRRKLGVEALITFGDDIRLDPDSLACDVWDFDEALRAGEYERAAELYAGPLLDGFVLDGSQPFEEWVERERDRFRREYRRALESLAAESEERGNATVAAHWWQRLGAEDPFDSRIAYRLMRALADSGNRAEALRIGRAHARLLADEFGAEPDTRLQTLTTALQRPQRRALDPALEPSTASDHESPPTRTLQPAGSAAGQEAAPHTGPGSAPKPHRSRLRPRLEGLAIAAVSLIVLLVAGDLLSGKIRRVVDAGGRRSGASTPARDSVARELYASAERLRHAGVVTAERNGWMIELYRRALQLDPELAEAWVGLANVYVGRAWMGDPGSWADSARAAARRAIELDPGLASAYTELGDSYWPDNTHLDEQIAAYLKALELEPGNTEATNNLVTMLELRGELAEAMMWLDRGQRVAPDSFALVPGLALENAALGRDSIADVWLEYARSRGHPLEYTEFLIELFHRGHIDRARQALERMSDPPAGVTLTRALGALALYRGHWAEARGRYREIFSGPRGASYHLYSGMLSDRIGLAYTLERLGQHTEARQIADGVVTQAEREMRIGNESYLPRTRRAVAELVRGDTTAAIHWLEMAVDAGYRDLRTMEAIPLLDGLRSDPRFRSLHDRVEVLVAAEGRRVEAAGWGLPR